MLQRFEATLKSKEIAWIIFKAQVVGHRASLLMIASDSLIKMAILVTSQQLIFIFINSWAPRHNLLNYNFMIISRQHQKQLHIFDPEHAGPPSQFGLSSSAFHHKKIRNQEEFKKKIMKRLSCHSESDEYTVNRENPSQQFSKKLLDNIFAQIKNNHKASQRMKAERNIIHAIGQKNYEILVVDGPALDCQNNMKIRSINNLIKPKAQNSRRNKTFNVPFQNKKLVNLRRREPKKLYSQQIQSSAIQPSNDIKILPWESYNNHILNLPGMTHEIDDQTAEQNYLKSHNLKSKDSKPFVKYSTIAFSMAEDKKVSIKKHISIDVTEPKVSKPNSNYNQIFSAHCVRQPQSKQSKRGRFRHDAIQRTLTEMKMDIEQINLQKSDNNTLANIRLQDFFECVIPKINFSNKKPSINYLHRPSQSFSKVSAENIVNCCLVGRRL